MPIRSDVQVFRAGAADVTGGQRANHDLVTAHLAHSPEWYRVIQSAYGHEPLYLIGEDGHGHRGILPAFVVRRPFFGTVVTSMPFLDAGGPSSSSASLDGALVERLVEEAIRIGARVVELRCTGRLALSALPREEKVTLTLALPRDAETLWGQFPGSVRSRVRRAQRAGLSVEFGGVHDLMAFYDVFAERMRDLGSPVHALAFLRAVLDGFGERARIVLVRKGRSVVGGLVAISVGDSIAVPWVSCRKEYFSLYPNMLLYWETLREACQRGLRRFDFGRSSRDSGTYQFKLQWGAREEPLFWYTLPLSGREARPGAGRGASLLTGSWRRLPLAWTRRLGPHIRKYLTQ